MGPTWVLSAPCWPHELCYQGQHGFWLAVRCAASQWDVRFEKYFWLTWISTLNFPNNPGPRIAYSFIPPTNTFPRDVVMKQLMTCIVIPQLNIICKHQSITGILWFKENYSSIPVCTQNFFTRIGWFSSCLSMTSYIRTITTLCKM